MSLLTKQQHVDNKSLFCLQHKNISITKLLNPIQNVILSDHLKWHEMLVLKKKEGLFVCSVLTYS